MKWMIASDIHGSAHYCALLLERYAQEKPGRLVLLGDILYHGPRNALPEGYDPQAVAALLNPIARNILCVRGNCDSEVDQMMLSFPLMADYAVIDAGAVLVYATHGHVFGEEHPLPGAAGGILLCGHTHVPACRRVGTGTDTMLYVNPGSVSLPKEDSPHSYLIMEENALVWKTVQDGTAYKRASF